MANITAVVVYDAATQKHKALATGDKLDRSVLDLAVGTMAWNPSTNELTATFADGTNTVVNLATLAADKFLSGSSYNPTTHELTLAMTDDSNYVVPLGDLVTVATVNTSTINTSGDGTTGNPLKGNVVISPNEGNQLTNSGNGLFVPAPTIPPLDFPVCAAATTVDDGTTPTTFFGGNSSALGTPDGWATVSVGGVNKRMPYWN